MIDTKNIGDLVNGWKVEMVQGGIKTIVNTPEVEIVRNRFRVLETAYPFKTLRYSELWDGKPFNVKVEYSTLAITCVTLEYQGDEIWNVAHSDITSITKSAKKT